MSEIGLYVKGKRVVGNFVIVDVGRVSTTMPPLQTNEIERLAHTISATKYSERPAPSDRRGFPYNLPVTLGR